MAFIIAALLVAGFAANVAIGAVAGKPLIGNVAEMMVLFAAAAVFVVGILRAEAARKKRNDTSK